MERKGSVAEQFAKIHGEKKKGQVVMNGQEPYVVLRYSHPFPEKTRVATVEVMLTRAELFEDKELQDKLYRFTLEASEKFVKDADLAMSTIEPLVGVLSPQKPSPATNAGIDPPKKVAQASGDDMACPKCHSKMTWITKDRKDGKKNKFGKVVTWSAWACPSTGYDIDVSERCDQGLIFPDKN